jgi:hypothetical protein
LDKLKQKFDEIGLMARNRFSNAWGSAYISGMAALRQLFSDLDKQRKEFVANLDDARKSTLLDLYKTADDLLSNKIAGHEAVLNADIISLSNRIRFLTIKTPFVVTRVWPTSILPKSSGDYTFHVTGVGVGDHEGNGIKTTVQIGRKEFVSAVSMELYTHYYSIEDINNTPDGITFSLPANAIDYWFGSFEFRKAPIIVKSTIPTSCWYRFLHSCPSPKDYSFEYQVTLFPVEAISATVEQRLAVPGFGETEKKIPVPVITANGDGNHMQPWSSDPVTPDGPNWEIIYWGLDTRSGPNGWCENYWGKPGDPCRFVYLDMKQHAIQNDGAVMKITGSNNSWPVKLNFIAVESERITRGVSLPPLHLDFAAGEEKTLEVDERAVTVRLNVETANGDKKIVPVYPPGSESIFDPVTCANRTEIGGGQVSYLCTAQDADRF